tara:strand:- start:251 stop:2011 length:1761 start_codon:yes stop_codon:yes gene_type:complete
MKKEKLNKLLKWVNDQDYICLDTEARGKYFGFLHPMEGLDPYLSEIISLQIGNAEEQHIIFGTPPKELMIALRDKLCIGHNIKYDYKLLYVATGIRLEKVFDTMIAEKLLNNSSTTIRYGLGPVLQRLFGIEMNKEIRDTFKQCVVMDATQIQYSLDDIKYLDRLYFSQLKRCKAKDMGDLFSIEMDVVKALSEMELNGMHLNEEDWMILYQENLEKEKILLQKLSDILWKHKKYQFFNIVEKKCLLNWNSSLQIIPVFLSYELDVTSDKHKSGFSIAEKNIKKYSENEFVEIYLEYKGVVKSITTYGKKFIGKYKNPITGKYHTNLTQLKNTGRSASSNPNLMNISVGGPRKCFNFVNSAEEKYYLVCDYSKQELCVLADRAEDHSLIATLEAEDAHEETAKKIFKEKYNRKKHRPIGKTVNFAVAYGSTAHALSESLNVNLDEAQSYIDLFYKAYPKLKPYFEKVYREALRKRFIRLDNVTNRKFYIDSYMSSDEILRKCQNYPIQSLSATITKVALVLLYEFTKNDDRINLIHVQHDEIIFEVTKDYKELESQVCDIMTEAGRKFLNHIELKVGSMVSKYWDH